MKKLIVVLIGLISLNSMFPTLTFAASLEPFVGTYTLQQGTEGMNSGGDLVCPTPLIFRLSLSALDSNMPQLPELAIAKLQENNTRYVGTLSANGAAFSYKQVTKSNCFLGLFCSTSTLEGSLYLADDLLTLTHTESSSADGILSTGNCTYTK